MIFLPLLVIVFKASICSSVMFSVYSTSIRSRCSLSPAALLNAVYSLLRRFHPYLRGLRLIVQPCGFEGGHIALQLANCPLYLPLLLRRLVGGVGLALVLERRLVDIRKLLVRVGSLGYALHPYASNVAAVRALQTIHIAQPTGGVDVRVSTWMCANRYSRPLLQRYHPPHKSNHLPESMAYF